MILILLSVLIIGGAAMPELKCKPMPHITGEQVKCAFDKLPNSTADTFAAAFSKQLGAGTAPNLATNCAWVVFLANAGVDTHGLTNFQQNPCSTKYCSRGFLWLSTQAHYEFCAKESYCECAAITAKPGLVASNFTVGAGTAACQWANLYGTNLDKYCDGTQANFKKASAWLTCGSESCEPTKWRERQVLFYTAIGCFI